MSCIIIGRTDTFCVTEHQETSEIDTKQLDTSKVHAAQFLGNFDPPKKINFKENFLSLYTFTNEGLVMEGNIIKKMT